MHLVWTHLIHILKAMLTGWGQNCSTKNKEEISPQNKNDSLYIFRKFQFLSVSMTVSTLNTIKDTLQCFHYDWPQVMFMVWFEMQHPNQNMASSDESENVHMTPWNHNGCRHCVQTVGSLFSIYAAAPWLIRGWHHNIQSILHFNFLIKGLSSLIFRPDSSKPTNAINMTSSLTVT